MNTTDILQATEASVSAVESKLTELDKLSENAQALSESIAALQNDETDLLASDAKSETRVKKLVEARARLDVAKADLSKVLIENEVAKEEVISLGIHADKFLCAIRDALVHARTDRVLAELAGLFKSNVLLELKRFAQFSLLVDEVESGHDRFVWVRSRPDLGLSNASKIRAEYDRLAAMANLEANLEIVVAPIWMGITDWVPVAAPAKSAGRSL